MMSLEGSSFFVGSLFINDFLFQHVQKQWILLEMEILIIL